MMYQSRNEYGVFNMKKVHYHWYQSKSFFYIEKSNKRVERFTVAAPEPFYVFDKKCLIDHSKRW